MKMHKKSGVGWVGLWGVRVDVNKKLVKVIVKIKKKTTGGTGQGAGLRVDVNEEV